MWNLNEWKIKMRLQKGFGSIVYYVYRPSKMCHLYLEIDPNLFFHNRFTPINKKLRILKYLSFRFVTFFLAKNFYLFNKKFDHFWLIESSS